MTVKVPPPVESLRADAKRNRSRVLDAARTALADGDDSLAANALAKRASVGVGTVYGHFPTRQTLLEGLAEEALGSLIDDATAAAQHEEPRRRLAHAPPRRARPHDRRSRPG